MTIAVALRPDLAQADEENQPFPESPASFLRYLATVNDNHLFFIYGPNTEYPERCPLAEWWVSRGLSGYICTDSYCVYTEEEKRLAQNVKVPYFIHGYLAPEDSGTQWSRCPDWATQFQQAWQQACAWSTSSPGIHHHYQYASRVKHVVQDLGYTLS